MSNLSQAPIPRIPMFDASGWMTREWQNWFRDLFTRVGGSDAPTNSEIISLVLSDFLKVVDNSELIQRLDSLEGQFLTFVENFSDITEQLTTHLTEILAEDQNIDAIETTPLYDTGFFNITDIPAEQFINELPDSVFSSFFIGANAMVAQTLSPATLSTYNAIYPAYSFASGSTESVEFNLNYPRGADLNSATAAKIVIYWHIPISGSGSGAENVQWRVTPTIANPQSSFSATPPATSLTVDVQGFLNTTCLYSDLISLSPNNALDQLLMVQIERVGGIANEYANAVFLLGAELVYERDTIGSTAVFSK